MRTGFACVLFMFGSGLCCSSIFEIGKESAGKKEYYQKMQYWQKLVELIQIQ